MRRLAFLPFVGCSAGLAAYMAATIGGAPVPGGEDDAGDLTVAGDVPPAPTAPATGRTPAPSGAVIAAMPAADGASAASGDGHLLGNLLATVAPSVAPVVEPWTIDLADITDDNIPGTSGIAAPTSAAPSAASSAACAGASAPCPKDKTQCCSGYCEKDEETGEKVCGGRAPAPADQCLVAGEPCVDKKLCCSGSCQKAKKDNKDKDKARLLKEEVCE